MISLKCRDCGTELTNKNWWLSSQNQNEYMCKDCRKKYQQSQYKKHRETRIKDSTIWNNNNAARHSKIQKKMERKVKFVTFVAYTPQEDRIKGDFPRCHKCGFSDIRALSLDMIKGGHRASGLPFGGTKLYRLLRKQDYPDGWQVLCMNCQYIKREENQELRHKY